MITVAILINGKPIMARSAVNKGESIGKLNQYAVDDGSTLLHNPDDGAVSLAVKLLLTIHEQQPTKPKGNKCKKRKRNQ